MSTSYPAVVHSLYRMSARLLERMRDSDRGRETPPTVSELGRAADVCGSASAISE